jgi:hypothetical protein
MMMRPVLWVVLVVSLAANMAISTSGMSPVLGAVFGAATLGSATGLIVQHYRTRRAQ